ncbi:MAG: hypothetical protein HN368_10170 [Spirochaetales bacterium]|nr:hypothetical protein [Spirochaetales bacterium]
MNKPVNLTAALVIHGGFGYAGSVEIREVRSKKELKSFIRLPKDLYSDDPLWVPPIWSDEKKAYSGGANPILKDSEYTLIVAMDGDRCVGRNLVYIDHAFNRFFRSKTGLFGAYECADDPSAAEMIIRFSENWLRERGMVSIRGPIHPIAESWGFLLEGDGRSPVFMTPHTPAGYLGTFEDMDYRKVMDLRAYEANAGGGYEIPERTRRFLDILRKKRPDISARRLNPRNLLEDAEHIWRLSNIAYADNWGYVPVE